MRRGIKTAFFAAAIILTAMLCVQGCKGQAVQTEAAESKAEATKRNAGTAGYGTAGVENGAEAVKNEAETTKEGLQTPSGGAAAKGQTPAGTASEPSAGAPAGGVEAKTASAPANEGAGDPAPPEETAGNPGKTALASPSVTGALRVEGAGLVGSGGEAVQLRGISTHGLAWFPDYVNEACFRELREDWQANVIRLALYTAEYGGYCSGGDREYLKGLVEAGVEYAAQADLYVIIDWHILSDGHPNTHLAEAKEFFGEMSARYADREHVLYEICNEPNGGTAWPEIKSYAEEVIGVIRENDTDAVILVGTPNWSQYVDQAAADPLSGYENVMYTLHFYAATHKEDLRERMTAAVEAGVGRRLGAADGRAGDQLRSMEPFEQGGDLGAACKLLPEEQRVWPGRPERVGAVALPGAGRGTGADGEAGGRGAGRRTAAGSGRRYGRAGRDENRRGGSAARRTF